MDTDPPPPKTPAPAWPPAPRLGPLEAAPGARRRTLTAHEGLDVVLGLVGGLLGALVLVAAGYALGSAVIPAAESAQWGRFSVYVPAALTVAACAFAMSRALFFGIALSVGAAVILLPALLLTRL